MTRTCYAVLHLLWNAAALLWLIATKRGGVLLFTHQADRDGKGRDAQLGPLWDGLRAQRVPLVEICLVPRSAVLWAAIRARRRAFLTTVPTELWSRLAAGNADPQRRLQARTQAAQRWLRWLAPRVVVLIDESGSGQPWLRAARSLGIRTIGVQHGDFVPGDPRYDLGVNPRGVVPADCLCVWSPWFAARLWARSPIYGPANTRTTGRLRYPPSSGPAAPGVKVRVLVLGSGTQAELATLAPFVAALQAHTAVEVAYRPHPAQGRAQHSLATDLAQCDIAVGRYSSALLEALWWRKPAVLCQQQEPTDHALQLLPRCATPALLPALCVRTAQTPPPELAEARALIFEPAPAEPAAAILATVLA